MVKIASLAFNFNYSPAVLKVGHKKGLEMNKNQRKGMTLIEVMVAAVVVVVAVLGAMAFRYVTALDARKADIQISAGRVGLLLLEGWKAEKGSNTYNPANDFTSGIVIVSTSAGGPAVPAGFTALATSGNGQFQIKDNQMYFYATLSFIASTLTEPRKLNVIVGWRPGAAQGAGGEATQNIKLTAYVNE